jgi:hypothetical protein
MRFRDFVYAFQRYTGAKVGRDDELHESLSQVYNAVSGKPREVQQNQARLYAQIFRQGQRNGERQLELRIMDGISKIALSTGGAGVAVEY